MAKTEYQISDADVGRVLPITNGFLTDLSMITPPVYELTRRGVSTAQGGKWLAGKVINVRKRLAVVS